MNCDFIMTRTIFPLENKIELKNCCFDNPRNGEEIKAIAKILKKANFIWGGAIPETYEQFGNDIISLEMALDEFFEKYNLDRKFLLRNDGKEYSNIYYKMAKNWVILRYNTDEESSIDEAYTRYQNTITYINLLTFLGFSDSIYKNQTLLLPECFDFFEMKTIDRTIKDILISFVVLGIANNEDEINNFKFCSFDKIYTKFIELENMINKVAENELIEYIATNINIYISTQDEKMRIITLVSILELLLTHKPDSTRYNVEDSIRKQFCNKLILLLYLNDNKINYEEVYSLLLKIYDLRSAIAHGSFKQIESELKMIHKWLLKNDKDYKELYEEENEYREDIVLEDVDEYLRNYVRITIKKYLEDKYLFDILKK